MRSGRDLQNHSNQKGKVLVIAVRRLCFLLVSILYPRFESGALWYGARHRGHSHSSPRQDPSGPTTQQRSLGKNACQNSGSPLNATAVHDGGVECTLGFFYHSALAGWTLIVDDQLPFTQVFYCDICVCFGFTCLGMPETLWKIKSP